MDNPNLCKEIVYTPDCLRRDGRGRYGFSMHYSRHQCKRKPTMKGYCTQHFRYHERCGDLRDEVSK